MNSALLASRWRTRLIKLSIRSGRTISQTPKSGGNGLCLQAADLEAEPQGVSKGEPAGADHSVTWGSRTYLPGSDKAPLP